MRIKRSEDNSFRPVVDGAYIAATEILSSFFLKYPVNEGYRINTLFHQELLNWTVYPHCHSHKKNVDNYFKILK